MTRTSAGKRSGSPQHAGRVLYRAISGETVQMRGHQGDMIDAYLARPDGTRQVPRRRGHPSHAGLGRGDASRSPASSLSMAIRPSARTCISAKAKIRPRPTAPACATAGGMPDDRTMGDVEGAIKYLRALRYLNGKVGIIGYCSGGRQVYLAACTLKGIDAAVACYPGGVGSGKRRADAAPARRSARSHQGSELPVARDSSAKRTSVPRRSM